MIRGQTNLLTQGAKNSHVALQELSSAIFMGWHNASLTFDNGNACASTWS
jgi:hypothetical protein